MTDARPATQPSYTLISTQLLAQLLQLDELPCRTDGLPRLRNRYFGLRHGQSEANVEGVISSNAAVATQRHGLTPLGRTQARQAATRLVDLVGREALDSLHFYSSDFCRARETAEETLAAVQNVVRFERSIDREDRIDLADLPTCLQQVHMTPSIRERCFGDLDGAPLSEYKLVWPRDHVSARHGFKGVEGVEQVAERVRDLVLELEAEHDGAAIVLVSHADVLQIAGSFIAGADPRAFSSYRFQNGEVRAFLQDAGALPPPRPLTYL